MNFKPENAGICKKNNGSFGELYWLVVEPTHLKNISQNGNLPQSRDENKTYLKPPPSLHLHLAAAQNLALKPPMMLTNVHVFAQQRRLENPRLKAPDHLS